MVMWHATFSHAGSAAWNSMPEHIRAEPDIRVFRKLLKTHLFNPAFNVHVTDNLVSSTWLLECIYVQHVIGTLQMHWMTIIHKLTTGRWCNLYSFHVSIEECMQWPQEICRSCGDEFTAGFTQFLLQVADLNEPPTCTTKSSEINEHVTTQQTTQQLKNLIAILMSGADSIRHGGTCPHFYEWLGTGWYQE